MIGTFKTIKPLIYFKPSQYSIDNFAFKLHYRWSFALLLICTLLVTSRQYIGEHIKCITGGSLPSHVVETFCFFTPTFTVIQHLNNTALQMRAIPHPGIGPLENWNSYYKENTIKRHAYYQWVPFVLFFQAILFYLPHYFWKRWEGGQIKSFSNGLKNIEISQYVRNTKSIMICNKEFPSKDTTDSRIQNIKITFKNRLKIYIFWAPEFIFCEILNLFNVLFQIYATNKFLAGQFNNLGKRVIEQNLRLELDVLDVVFPKITKCHFHKYGPSGSLQLHDALCVMSLNIINEKIYTLLWFWFMIMLIVSVLALFWRLIIVCMYKNPGFSSILFSYSSPGRLNRQHIKTIIEHCNFSSWMFLYFLGSNIDGYLFREILEQLANEFRLAGQQYNENIRAVDENEANKLSEEDEILVKSKPIDTVDSRRIKELAATLPVPPVSAPPASVTSSAIAADIHADKTE